MGYLGFLLFLIPTHFVALAIFTLTTYHAYFWKALPLLLTYSVGIGWALFALELHGFFLPWIVGETIWLFIVGRGEMRDTATCVARATDLKDAGFVAESHLNTMVYYMLSCIVYVLSTAVSYLYFLNRAL